MLCRGLLFRSSPSYVASRWAAAVYSAARVTVRAPVAVRVSAPAPTRTAANQPFHRITKTLSALNRLAHGRLQHLRWFEGGQV